MDVVAVKMSRAANTAPPAAGRARGDTLKAVAAEIKGSLGAAWLPTIYRERIRTQRTRAFRLGPLPKGSRVAIQHTLLGVELKVGRRRILCPDLSTARYLAVFAHVGSAEVAVPYDITQVSRFADELESAWHRLLLLIDHRAAARTDLFRSRLRTALVGEARKEIEAAGAGALIPQFNQNTRQRRRQ
jgi:hypothetical protein